MATRRDFIRDASLIGAVGLTLGREVSGVTAEQLTAPQQDPHSLARDEAFWARVAAQYRAVDGIVNLEGGSFGQMALPVLDAFHRHADRANDGSSYFGRREYGPIYNDVRRKIAAFIGASPAETMIVRNASDALQTIIGRYNKVGPGDTVMYADLDFSAAQQAMVEMAARRGATVATLDIPEPADRDSVLAAYRAALDANPKTKLLLLTHCNNKTGLLLPVKDIVALARQRGADVVVDAAHSFGQVAVTVADFDAEFVALNLHKWVGGSPGVGVMYIRTDALGAVDAEQGPEALPRQYIDARLHVGAMNMAAVMTVSDALAFQASIGLAKKAARLRYLRDRWVSAVRAVPGVEVLTPDDAQLVGAMSSFRLHGDGDAASNVAITKTLFDEFKILTFARTGLAKGDCVRVTPTLCNSAADVDQLSAAITAIAARGR
jgi:selenocysteine lyase/cysteine desulfurase